MIEVDKPRNQALASDAPGYRLKLPEMAPDERKGETVTDLAQRLLAQTGGLRGVYQLTVTELAAMRGIGDAKAVKVQAALELGRRLAVLEPSQRLQVGSPEDVANLLQVEMGSLTQEQLRVVCLDTRHRVLHVKTVYQGTANQAQVRVAEVFRDAIRENAPAMIVVHNHPSGDPTPSAADVALTMELVQAGRLLDIDLLDHLIIGGSRWLSLKRLGLGFPVTAP
jgi:DNA repair protein RadC